MIMDMFETVHLHSHKHICLADRETGLFIAIVGTRETPLSVSLPELVCVIKVNIR